MRFRRVRTAAACALVALMASSVPAGACSVCRCGDPTFNALGTGIFERGQFRLALDWERLEKSQGADDAEPGETHLGATSGLRTIASAHEGEHGGREELTEERLVVTLSYAPTERLELVGRLPWSRRELREEGESTSASGAGDPEFYALFRLWSAEWQQGLGRRSWLSLVGGLKTDWGENEQRRAGERLDEHLQSGTGSVDPFAGLSFVHLLDATSSLYGSAQYRRPGRNDSGYRYGDALLANAGYERKLGTRFDGTIELNYRDAAPDEIDPEGETDPDTGGAILFVSPRLLLHLGRSIVARVAVQIPVWDGLDGEQEEKTVINLGITASF
ncbi:MAG: hypothetical protein AB7G12_13175 [Thermoanaerobaculia bacterium]